MSSWIEIRPQADKVIIGANGPAGVLRHTKALLPDVELCRSIKKPLTAKIAMKRRSERRERCCLFFFVSSAFFLCDLGGQRLSIVARFPFKTSAMTLVICSRSSGVTPTNSNSDRRLELWRTIAMV